MLLFASAAIGISLSIAFIQKRFTFVPPTHAGQCSSAGRSVKPFLISSAIVSSWTCETFAVRDMANVRVGHASPEQCQRLSVRTSGDSLTLTSDGVLRPHFGLQRMNIE